MKHWIAGAVAVAQIVLLGYMAGEREWIFRTGQTVILRTAPLDPNDPMRGEYVRLDYDFNVVPRRLCRDGVAKWFDESGLVYRQLRDRVVFARLEIGPDNLAELVALTDVEPKEGVFLRGRTEWLNENTIRIRYGIEAFFMQQGKARALENEMRKERRGALLNIEAAVSASGTAVLRDYEWEPLGITLTFEREETTDPANPAARRNPLRAINVELKNHGIEPVAIVDRPDEGSFRLVRDERRGSSKSTWAVADLPTPPARTEDVRILQPGEAHRAHIDLSLHRWKVLPSPDAAPVALGELTQAWGASFRIEYVPPARDEVGALPSSSLIFSRTLRSAAFTPAGMID